MESLSKNQILASSSGWVATGLNLFPGLGAGYLYQRRWIQYFITLTIVASWFAAGAVFNNGETEPSEIEKLIGLGGLLLVSIATMIEANLAHRKSIQKVKKELQASSSNSQKRRGLFGR